MQLPARSQVLAELAVPDIGIATLYQSRVGGQHQPMVELCLNPYQSNCLAQWLGLRWVLSQLCGAVLYINPNKQLLIQAPFFEGPSAVQQCVDGEPQLANSTVASNPRAALQLWSTQLQQQLTRYLVSRR